MIKYLLIIPVLFFGLGGTFPVVAQDAMPAAEASQVININTADAETLSSALTGIGMTRAQAIINYREEFGPFLSVDDLLEVDGIGPAILTNNRHLLALE